MLSQDQIDLIHQEIDGANTPEGSAAFRSLVEKNPEARALAADLRRVAGLFAEVGEREPPPHLKWRILDALPQPARASPRTMLQWATHGLRLVAERTEEAIMNRKAVLIGTAAVAIVLVVAGIVTGWPPLSGGSGTIGGVEQAARYHGRAMTAADVTLKNPEIQALFQNDQVLQLIRSDAFRQAMNNQAFRTLAASDAYRTIVNNQAYAQLVAGQAYAQLLGNQAYAQLVSNQAYAQLMASQAFRDMQASSAYQTVMASQAYQQVAAGQAYQTLMASQAFRNLQANAAYAQMMAGQAFRDLVASQAFRTLQQSEAFRSLAQSQAMSQAFMREAMRTQN